MKLLAVPVSDLTDATLNFEQLQRLLTIPAWTAPTLINSWANAGGVAYLKDALGFVHLRGSVQTGTSTTVAFVLPAGFRPGIADFYPALQGSGTAGSFVAIDTSGNVTPTYTVASRVWLNGITFLAER